MPPRNARKQYVDNGYYHIYNRGVEKRTIFQDEQDYGVFLSYLKVYLTPKNTNNLQEQLSNPKINWNEKSKIIKHLRLNNFSAEVKLLAYCLMPNHFHLLIKQKTPDSIDRIMNSLGTRYVMYFNKKYDRVGHLYQGVYKAVLVDSDEQLIHLSAYIHKNPAELHPSNTLKGQALKSLTSQPSSLPEYLGVRKTEWLSTKEILPYFSKTHSNASYKQYLLGYKEPGTIIREIVID